MLVAFVGLALGPMTLLGSLILYQAERALGERVAAELRVGVEAAAAALETHLGGVRREVLSLARFLQRRLEPRMTEAQWRTVEEEFLQIVRAERAYYQVRFIAADGMENLRVNNQAGELVLVPKEQLQYKGDRYYFREAMALAPGQAYLSRLDFNEEFGVIEEPRRLVVRVAAPVAGPGGELRGVVVINVFGEELLDALETLRPSPGIRVVLFNEDNRFVEMEQAGGARRFRAGSVEELQLWGRGLALRDEAAAGGAVIRSGDWLLASAPVQAAPDRLWQLAKVYPNEVLAADLRRIRETSLLVAGPLVLLAALLAMLAARSFSLPIRQLLRFAEGVAGGDYRRRSEVRSRDELGQLSAELNAMAASLAESRERLLDWNRNLQRQVDQKVQELRRTEAEAEQARKAMASLEKQLILADRLAALGMLSATVAHEIGNPLAGLKTRLQMLRRKAEPDSPLAADLEKMLALVERLGAFLGHLTGYVAPRQAQQSAEVDVCRALREVEFILKEEADRRGAQLTLDMPREPLPVCSREQYLHQVFMNLVLNALQAVGEKGMVQVKARRGGGRVRVEVRDNGPGFSATDRDRIFEPLFTTKPEGTGLGLAIVRKLVEELGGTVEVANHPQGGAVAQVLLPERRAECGEES
ncbi:hypothetical protein DESUT3_26930 [Desulfuromonas versatilis]|uniref:histidine kinase n=2 Tax=Desulfuromonas versatilis TaxID=2802975 RepID=A0ABM8HXU6_9BACT|nr:hypothetical protein DESUT3_26930 [Desulfuromonas versatilis]